MDLLRSQYRNKKEIPPARLKVREHPKDGPYVQGILLHHNSQGMHESIVLPLSA